ncbi:PhoH family protein [Bordetella sp. 15P40C-2]|uniref:PhoH family protein n=1 Tax=Bordetella sp. 15P40C-2 TaxID=2572246 RepID=UPI001326585E|nr:PhoH family protein [Bordetella sp. 15P40C-2]MVW71088.1 AAA family ATPase [Bordetella sp. 15P40C-2]
MPLPKLPSRPAAILTFPSGESPSPKARSTKAAKKAATPPAPEAAEALPVQPELSGLQTAAKAREAAPAPNVAKLPVGDPAPVAEAPKPAKKAPAASPAKASTRKGRAQADNGPRRLFVLDTNVLLHDPSSLFRFQEHDIYLPMMTLEELDHQKKGMSEVARNARQVSRSLDALVQDATRLDDGLELSKLGNKDATGRLMFQTTAVHSALPDDLPMGKADNQILGVVRALQEKYKDREVVLVSKDINMRLKARTLGMAAEDYYNDHVLEDSDLLYPGVLQLPDDFWNRHGKDVESWQQGGTTFYRIHGPLCSQFVVNQFVYFDGQLPLHAQVREVSGKTAVLATLRDYTHGKNNVWGITARNREQNFAMNLLMNPDCDFVSLLGQAGTGKTLLALAAGITQVLETKRYNEIIMTRVTVPVGDDIGFLPGTEEEKMLPWMGALEDNLDVLNMNDSESGADWGRAATMDLIRSRIKVKSLNFMRGRTFLNKYLIIDEAQNLTPKQMKTLITRAGPGTKVVCLGNVAQIDTPYLTEGSSGLTFVVDRFKGWPHAGHVTLQRGERSRLADYAGDVL